MPSGHAKVRGLLAAHAVGALESSDVELVEEHVDACSACRDELRQLQEVATSTLGSEAEAPDALWDRVSSSLGQRPEGSPAGCEGGPAGQAPAVSDDREAAAGAG